MTDADAPSGRRRRRHRRVVAPPTNPAADPSDDVPAETRVSRTGVPSPAPAEDAREAWIRSQRPPHWD